MHTGSFACPSGLTDFDAHYEGSGETLLTLGTQLVAVTQLYFEQDMNTDIDLILRMPNYYDINFGGYNTATGRTGVSSIEAFRLMIRQLLPIRMMVPLISGHIVIQVRVTSKWVQVFISTLQELL